MSVCVCVWVGERKRAMKLLVMQKLYGTESELHTCMDHTGEGNHEY